MTNSKQKVYYGKCKKCGKYSSVAKLPNNPFRVVKGQIVNGYYLVCGDCGEMDFLPETEKVTLGKILGRE